MTGNDLTTALDTSRRVLGAALAPQGDAALPSVDAVGDEQLLELVEQVQTLTGQLEATHSLLVAEVERRDAAQKVRGITTGAWLRETGWATPRQAHRIVKDALRLVGLPVIWRGLARGDVTPRQAQSIIDTLKLLPAELSPADETRAQSTMVAHAAEFDPAELRAIGNRLVEVIDPDHADALLHVQLERRDRNGRFARELHLIPDGHGSMKIRGQLPLADGEHLAALVDAVANRRSEPPRDPTCQACTPLPEPERCPRCRATATSPVCGPSCPGAACGLCGGRPSRGMLRADALIEIAQAFADADLAPEQGADRPRLNITVPFETLRSGRGHAEVTEGHDLSATELRRLACDAVVVPMAVDANGVPRVVGSEQRLFTREVRAALIARDGGCAFPGCDRPPRACEGHHVLPWWRGGTTTLDNGVLLCRHHHALVEPRGDRTSNPDRWEVRVRRDGLPEFLPPRALDPTRGPRQHLRHRRRSPQQVRQDEADGPG